MLPASHANSEGVVIPDFDPDTCSDGSSDLGDDPLWLVNVGLQKTHEDPAMPGDQLVDLITSGEKKMKYMMPVSCVNASVVSQRIRSRALRHQAPSRPGKLHPSA